jgi:CDP-paratose 2-epimerase
MMEAIKKCENLTGNKMNVSYNEQNRIGDHIWWISDVSKFKQQFPAWDYKYDIDDILTEIFAGLTKRL